MPKISIIIPVYNSENYLIDCLESVRNQVFNDFEVILVDDGSKDGSSEICDDYCKKDPRFRVIHKQNGGVASARNTGLSVANGEWIAFVDSDDQVLPGYLDGMLKLTGDGCQLVVSDLKNGEAKDMRSIELDADCLDQHPSLLSGSPWNKLFLTDIIRKKAICFPVGISTMEDNIFVWNYLLECQYVSVSSNNNYTYNIHSDSLVRSVHKIEEIYKLCISIYPIYERLLEELSFKQNTIQKFDFYIYTSCLKRLLISDSKGLSLSKKFSLIASALKVMNNLIARLYSRNDLNLKDRLLLFAMRNRLVLLLAFYKKL